MVHQRHTETYDLA